MEFPKPQFGLFNVYSKSGCSNCNKVKTLLKDRHISFNVIDCDEFILENKEEFLSFMQILIGYEYKMFPIVFDGSKFVGGFTETNNYLDKILDFDL